MMHRVLLLFFIAMIVGWAMAQPPVDYTIRCVPEDREAEAEVIVADDVADLEVIGVASYVDGKWHLALLDGATCAGELQLFDMHGNPVFVLGDDGTVAMVGDDGAVDQDANGEVEPLVVRTVFVPQQALDGMLGAHANRAQAATRGARGSDPDHELDAEALSAWQSEALELPERPEHPERPERPDRPDRPALPVLELPDLPEEVEPPELPELPVAPELPPMPELPVMPELPEASGGQPDLPEPAQGRGR